MTFGLNKNTIQYKATGCHCDSQKALSSFAMSQNTQPATVLHPRRN